MTYLIRYAARRVLEWAAHSAVPCSKEISVLSCTLDGQWWDCEFDGTHAKLPESGELWIETNALDGHWSHIATPAPGGMVESAIRQIRANKSKDGTHVHVSDRVIRRA